MLQIICVIKYMLEKEVALMTKKDRLKFPFNNFMRAGINKN